MGSAERLHRSAGGVTDALADRGRDVLVAAASTVSPRGRGGYRGCARSSRAPTFLLASSAFGPRSSARRIESSRVADSFATLVAPVTARDSFSTCRWNATCSFTASRVGVAERVEHDVELDRARSSGVATPVDALEERHRVLAGLTSGPDPRAGVVVIVFAARLDGSGRVAPGSRRSHVTRCMPSPVGPNTVRTTLPSASETTR